MRELEQKLQTYHRIQMPVHCVANGSLGLQIALKALGVNGEVVTTPFSYVATTACPLWEGCTVKFADIEPDTLTIDPRAVEAAVTPKTEAILATHVFGNPCDCKALEAIAKKHGLALIFDAAHAFGVTYKGKSILEYGDASMVSLHATKLFHAVEGGFVLAKDPVVAEKMEWMRRFGHKGPEEFHGLGINAKMSELHAAMGLCNLRHILDISIARERLDASYSKLLRELCPDISPVAYRHEATRNYSYYPILLKDEELLKAAVQKLNDHHFFPRRYFYPVLHNVDYLPSIGSLPVAESVSSRILCLPLSAHLSFESVGDVVRLLQN